MNREELEARMKAAMMPQGEVGFGPLELLIIGAALSTLVGWLVTRCLDSLWPASVSNPSAIAKWRLKRWCRQAVYEAIEDEAPLGDVSEADEVAMVDRLYEAALQVGRGMTATDLQALKAGCKT